MMYAKIDPTEFEAKSKKKYELSLKRSKQALSNRDGLNLPSGAAMRETPKFSDESSDYPDSQNIELRVSDSFLVQDTQEKEKLDADAKSFGKEEVILISDSSEEETANVYEWTRLKTREFVRPESGSPRGAIYTIRSSESEEESARRDGRSFRADPSRRRSSMYTSDETFSDETLQKFHNKENLLRSRINNLSEKSIVPDSDESIFSFDKMRGVLTDNRRNVPAVSSRLCERTNGKRVAGKSPANERAPGDWAERAESPKETSRRIEEWRRTPEFSKEWTNESESPKKSMEIQRKFGESQRGRAIGENRAGSANKSKETHKRTNLPDKTPELSKNETGSLNELKETYKRIEVSEKSPSLSGDLIIETERLNSLRLPRTPECATIAHAQTGSPSNRKEASENSAKSRDTRQYVRIAVDASSRNLQETPGQTDEARGTLLSAKKSSSRTILSKRDVRKILRVVESKRAVYKPPGDYGKPRNSDDSEIDDGSDEEAISSADSKASSKNPRHTENAVVIAETDSDTEDEIIRGSKVDLSRPYKTHVTRFLDPAANNETTPDGMSRSKQLEIAHWLMTNSPAPTGESSISNVSPSNKYSLSSGNSSLERLEMEYETPNNRDKLRKLHDEKRKYKQLHSAKSRQTTIDNFVKKSEDGTRKMLTPVPVTTRKKVSPDGKKLNENLGIEDCADILDNLYGNVWRSKANDLLPLTEPRKKNILLRDKGVQTERKVNARSKRVTKSSDSSLPEDGFDTFVRNIKPNLNSTKKVAKRPDRDRFIKDSSPSSESSGETTYLTALTNPRISNDRKINNRQTPLAPNVQRPSVGKISRPRQRAIAICDSETDDEDEKLFDNRKALSFSDDERDSNTSEYDPIDVVPVGTARKTYGATAISRNATKSTEIPVSAINSRITKPKSNFLESLSTTIALKDAHPDAKKYRQDFKNTKEELSKYLYKLYNEKIFDNKLPSDMSIEWNVRMRGTAGFCYNKRSVKALGGVTRSSRIVLATKILDTPDRLRDTLVHEMCHAAAWLINDVSDGHGPFWKGWAAKASRAFPELPPIKRCHDYKITTKFTYRCTGCGYSVGRHSKSLDVDRKRCGHCYGKFELLINKMTKSGKVESRTPVSKKPSAFALFVKENYSTVKKNRKGVPHKEVMQILGQQFSAIKISKKNNHSDENNSVSGD